MHAKARAVTPLKLAASPRLQDAGLSYVHQYSGVKSVPGSPSRPPPEPPPEQQPALSTHSGGSHLAPAAKAATARVLSAVPGRLSA